ncbi:MAG: NYN domain-containing protein [Rhodospirillaceae bacterium]|nr:NYN domain-containing protein [Rhodospirillaceae bacterium]
MHSNETYSLFIDGSNLYSAARLLGFDIDYKKLMQRLSGHGRLIRTYYYTAIMENQDYSPIRPLVDWLDYNGYTVITKPAKEFIDDEGKRKIKGDMDVEIAVDMLELSEKLDHVVLFSGDGDFRHLIEAVQRKNTRVTVVSTVQSNPPMAADEMRRQADFFVELNDLADGIAKKRLGQQNFDNSADDLEIFEDNFDDEAVVEVA